MPIARDITIPNFITILRIILAPIFVIYLLNDRLISALVVFVTAGISDGLDGLIARVFNQRSTLGAYLDPLADKLLLVSAFVTLAARGFMPAWLTVVVISRDVLILLGVLILFLAKSSFTVKPIVLSKLSTCFQIVSVIVVLTLQNFMFSQLIHRYIFWATAIVTIISGLQYIRQWLRLMEEEKL